jgi:hypothetical protein
MFFDDIFVNPGHRRIENGNEHDAFEEATILPAYYDADTVAAAFASAQAERRSQEQQAWEEAQLARNRHEMILEDEASHLLLRLMEDDNEEEDNEEVVAPRRKRSFDRWYFFPSMPKSKSISGMMPRHRRGIGGWEAGSGLDNGDEEMEEAEVHRRSFLYVHIYINICYTKSKKVQSMKKNHDANNS